MPRQIPRIGPSQAREAVRSISCTSNLLSEVKAKIAAAWRRGTDTRTLATMYRVSRLEVEAVVHEAMVRKAVITFPGPRPTGPAVVQLRRAA